MVLLTVPRALLVETVPPGVTVLIARTLQLNIAACHTGRQSSFMLTATVLSMNELIFGLVFHLFLIVILLFVLSTEKA